MALVLCTGIDPSVVRTRQLILERAGHVVVPALDKANLIKACQQDKLDVAVLADVPQKLTVRVGSLAAQ